MGNDGPSNKREKKNLDQKKTKQNLPIKNIIPNLFKPKKKEIIQNIVTQLKNGCQNKNCYNMYCPNNKRNYGSKLNNIFNYFFN